MNLNIIRGEEFNVRVINNNIIYKIFKVKFFKKDGSIFVFFPYFKYCKGILSISKYPANLRTAQKIELEKSGRVTSHLVKYSHRPDGNVHFSLDKGIYTFKKNRKAAPLSSDVGHIFSVIFKNLDAFDKEIKKEKKELNIDFKVASNIKNDFKIVCEWQKIRNYNFFDEKLTPVIKTEKGFEKDKIISQPTNMPFHNHVLIFDIYENSLQSVGKEDLLLFIGGFDNKIIYKDLGKDFYFLTMMYPANDYEELKEVIGSQDFISV